MEVPQVPRSVSSKNHGLRRHMSARPAQCRKCEGEIVHNERYVRCSGYNLHVNCYRDSHNRPIFPPRTRLEFSRGKLSAVGDQTYTCSSCTFRSSSLDEATSHVAHENRSRRADSWWRHEIRVAHRTYGERGPVEVSQC